MLWRGGALLLLGEFGGYVLPLLLEPISRTYGIGESATGFVFALHLGGYAAAAIALAPWLRRIAPRRAAIVSVACIVAGNLLSAASPSLAALVAGRIVVGLGEGAAAATASALIARAGDPHRAFARAFAAVVVMTIVIYGLLPPLFAGSNARHALAALALAPLVWLPLLLALPREALRDVEPLTAAAASDARPGVAALLVCAAVTSCSIAANAPWVYLERIAAAMHMDAATFGRMISLAAVLAVVGPLAAWRLGDRGGRVLPVAIGCALVAGGAFVATHSPWPLPYSLGFAVSSAALLFVTPLMLALAARIDLSGRAAGAARGFNALGSTLAPAIAGLVVGATGGYRAIGWVSVAAAALAVALVALAVALHARPARVAAGRGPNAATCSRDSEGGSPPR